MLDDFPVGKYRYEIFTTGRLITWLRIDTENTAAPIESRRLKPTARRREVIAAFNA